MMKNIAKKTLKLSVFQGGRKSKAKQAKETQEDFPYMDLIDDDCIMFYKGNSFYGQTTILGAIEMLKEFDGYRFMNEETYNAIVKQYKMITSE